MVQRITDDEMKAKSSSAKALKQEASKGIGTPLERRIADALLENAHNMDAHTQVMNEVLERSQKTLEIANETLERANKTLYDAEQIIERAELLTYSCVDAVESGSEKAVRETAARELKLMRTELHESAEDAKEAIKRAKEASQEWKFRASRTGWFHSLTTAGKMVAIACVLFCTFMCIYTGWRAFPLI